MKVALQSFRNFLIELLQWHKVSKLDGDEHYRTRVAALKLFSQFLSMITSHVNNCLLSLSGHEVE